MVRWSTRFAGGAKNLPAIQATKRPMMKGIGTTQTKEIPKTNFSRKGKIMVGLVGAMGWGLWQFLLQDIFMYPAMISAKTLVENSTWYFPITVLTGGFAIGFILWGIVSFTAIQNPGKKLAIFSIPGFALKLRI